LIHGLGEEDKQPTDEKIQSSLKSIETEELVVCIQ
jgi:hypothetical protein